MTTKAINRRKRALLYDESTTTTTTTHKDTGGARVRCVFVCDGAVWRGSSVARGATCQQTRYDVTRAAVRTNVRGRPTNGYDARSPSEQWNCYYYYIFTRCVENDDDDDGHRSRVARARACFRARTPPCTNLEEKKTCGRGPCGRGRDRVPPGRYCRWVAAVPENCLRPRPPSTQSTHYCPGVRENNTLYDFSRRIFRQ